MRKTILFISILLFAYSCESNNLNVTDHRFETILNFIEGEYTTNPQTDDKIMQLNTPIQFSLKVNDAIINEEGIAYDVKFEITKGTGVITCNNEIVNQNSLLKHNFAMDGDMGFIFTPTKKGLCEYKVIIANKNIERDIIWGKDVEEFSPLSFTGTNLSIITSYEPTSIEFNIAEENHYEQFTLIYEYIAGNGVIKCNGREMTRNSSINVSAGKGLIEIEGADNNDYLEFNLHCIDKFNQKKTLPYSILVKPKPVTLNMTVKRFGELKEWSGRVNKYNLSTTYLSPYEFHVIYSISEPLKVDLKAKVKVYFGTAFKETTTAHSDFQKHEKEVDIFIPAGEVKYPTIKIHTCSRQFFWVTNGTKPIRAEFTQSGYTYYDHTIEGFNRPEIECIVASEDKTIDCTFKYSFDIRKF